MRWRSCVLVFKVVFHSHTILIILWRHFCYATGVDHIIATCRSSVDFSRLWKTLEDILRWDCNVIKGHKIAEFRIYSTILKQVLYGYVMAHGSSNGISDISTYQVVHILILHTMTCVFANLFRIKCTTNLSKHCIVRPEFPESLLLIKSRMWRSWIKSFGPIIT